MFSKIFKYRLMINFKQKENFFWTLCFPLILATLFNMAFGSLGKLDKIESIPVAIVDLDDSGKDTVSTLEKIDILEVKKADEKKADELLKKGKVDAIIKISNSSASISVTDSDYNQTIVKSIVDQISRTKAVITDIYSINPQGVATAINNMTSQSSQSYTENSSDSGKNNDQYAIFFFALIAMTCLFASSTGLYSVINVQANQSDIGARQSLSPVRKIQLFGIHFLCDIITQTIGCIILLYYIKYILKFNIGKIDGWMILLIAVSIFACLSIGTFLSSVVKAKESVKVGIITSFSLVSSGISGLFANQVKAVVEGKLPIIKYINPATLISDGLISLYYYNSISKYLISIAILGGAGIVLFTGTCLVLRRQIYESI